MYAHPPAPILTVAVVGAESTGKTSLVDQLHILAQQHSVVCDSVHEHLRDWVVQHKRTPQTHEQQGIAQAQQQATQLAYNNLQHREPIETLAPTAATAKPSHASGIRLLLLDTTAILTAAYSAHYFNDHSLWAQAFSSEPQVDLYLLMGLDVAWQADGLQRDGEAARHSVDQQLRLALRTQGLDYQVVYGQGDNRTQAAWMAIQSALLACKDPPNKSPKGLAKTSPNFHAWGCEGCSDADCERTLFKGLL